MPLLDSAPTTLLDLLSNSLILRQTIPYLSILARLRLSATSHAFKHLIFDAPDVFRHVDLSNVKSADIKISAPLDSGGMSWRAERMDEGLTEDEFYSGPLLGIFSKLQRKHVLKNVQTLILDGLCVPADLVREIVCETRFNVRILSIREAKNLNERKLMQMLKYAVRPSRAEGTPRLKALYYFGAKEVVPVAKPKRRTSSSASQTRPSMGVMASAGAQIGAEWNQKSSNALDTALGQAEKWYRSSGRMLRKRVHADWANTLKACEGIIHFDAVLCRGPRHDAETAFHPPSDYTGGPHPLAYLPPAVANVALGSLGCSTCSSCPERPALFGEDPTHWFPLLSPPPLHASTLRAAQTPSIIPGSPRARFLARCEDCLRGRWCERCNKWWDESCYAGSGDTRTHLQQQEVVQAVVTAEGAQRQREIKMGVKRDCFGCGHTCEECKPLYIRICHTCSNEYCVVDNEGSTATKCDWCVMARRTRALY